MSTEEPQGHDPTENRTVFPATEAQPQVLGKESREEASDSKSRVWNPSFFSGRAPQPARSMGPLLCGAGNLVFPHLEG